MNISLVQSGWRIRIAAAHTAGTDEGEHTPYPSHVTLYRGLHFGTTTPEEVDEMHAHPHEYLNRVLNSGHHRLGIHWTPNAGIAEHFALGHDQDPEGWEPEPGQTHSHGVILQADVHPFHVLTPGSPEHQTYSESEGIYDRGHEEQEHTLRDHARVDVTHAHLVSQNEEGLDDRLTSIPYPHRGSV